MSNSPLTHLMKPEKASKRRLVEAYLLSPRPLLVQRKTEN